MRPSFLVIGAQKCATSSLCGQLGRHPDVFMCDPKEPYFFSDPEAWGRGWSWYESLFAAGEESQAIGEGSTTYSMHGLYPDVADRIASHLPDARLIYIVRDPLERIQSHWMHLRSRQNRETQPFDHAVKQRPEYIDNSLYHKQIEIYRSRFPAERILVLFFDDYKRDHVTTMTRCLKFLDVDPHVPLADESPATRHASAGGRVDRGITPWIRRIPFFERMRRRAPTVVRESARRALKQPIGERPTWSDDTRAWAIERLYEDSRAILEGEGKELGLWPWVEERSKR